MGHIRDCHQQIHLSMQVDIRFRERDLFVPYERLIAAAHRREECYRGMQVAQLKTELRHGYRKILEPVAKI